MRWTTRGCLSTALGCLYIPSRRASLSGSEKSAETPPNDAYTMRLYSQSDLVMVGVSASGQLYKVDEDIVLKSGRIFEPPSSNAPSQDHWFYASETLFHANLLKNEQFVMRLLQEHPHPNIVEIIDADHPEGIYLRQYVPLTDLDHPITPTTRMQWYYDIASALEHLHTLGIAHSDLRMANVVFDDNKGSRARLYDFSAAAPFGGPNIVLPDQPVPIHGLASALSDATDRFALGCLIYLLEHGTTPGFGVSADGMLVLPDVRTGHAGLDRVVRTAWLGGYGQTGQMRAEIASLRVEVVRRRGCEVKGLSRVELQERVWEWRERREQQFGCVLFGVPSEETLQALAGPYGWKTDEDLRFRGYVVLESSDGGSGRE